MWEKHLFQKVLFQKTFILKIRATLSYSQQIYAKNMHLIYGTHPLIHSRWLWPEVWEVQRCVRKWNHTWEITDNSTFPSMVLSLESILYWLVSLKGEHMLTGVGEHSLGMACQQQKKNQVEHWSMKSTPQTMNGSEE